MHIAISGKSLLAMLTVHNIKSIRAYGSNLHSQDKQFTHVLPGRGVASLQLMEGHKYNTILDLHNALLHNNTRSKANDPCMQHGLANIWYNKIIQLIINYPVAYYR